MKLAPFMLGFLNFKRLVRNSFKIALRTGIKTWHGKKGQVKTSFKIAVRSDFCSLRFKL
jgi:hypothetical protein